VPTYLSEYILVLSVLVTCL